MIGRPMVIVLVLTLVLESPIRSKSDVRACLKIGNDAAAGDFAFERGGATGASPLRAVTGATTKHKSKRPAARRVFGARAGWRRCSSVEDP